ncbi:DNA-dependent metalloprotease SPRTN [Pelobates fuscus]|uniref:DNA-dependent metalloprotease SPRTN n=1 Tax=Pelobates fuscus TaxID=191477 RepID=UPI002FE48250
MEDDFLLAVQLQSDYDRGIEQPFKSYDGTKDVYSNRGELTVVENAKSKEMSVVDPTWELLDPSPDIRALFMQFNDKFFWGKLVGVEVKWSTRMTLCAGVCSYEGRGGLCSIRLSEPLLKLRPRKDLVETLLHEMIHALLFVTYNNKDHDSHGPEFCKHMKRINCLTGANISVYHNFHDEVDEYRKHWWLCNGPCQARKPYFGYVKRAMNRAPSALDPWWSDHQRTCGGTFIKVKEPENYGQKEGKRHGSSKCNSSDKGKNHGVDIRTIIPFSGVGYKLVQTSKSDMPHTSNTSTGNTKNLLPSSSSTFILNNKKPLLSQEKYMHSKSGVPMVSVANPKVFLNVNGSPIKLPVKRTKVHSENTSPRIADLFLSNMTEKKMSIKTSKRSATTSITSQGLNNENIYGQSTKRPRMQDEKAVEDFLLTSPWRNAKNKHMQNINSTAAPSDITTASSSQQSVTVSCPVCRTEVLELNVNEHLDSCLAVY